MNELDAGAQVLLNPSLVLAPESALSLLPSRGLSSAPVSRSVSPMVALSNDGRKKQLDYHSAFRHGNYLLNLFVSGSTTTWPDQLAEEAGWISPVAEPHQEPVPEQRDYR